MAAARMLNQGISAGVREPISYFYPYMTREKAMKHVERWAADHWASVPPTPPRPAMA